MSGSSSTRDPDEGALAAFVADLQRRGSGAIADYVARFPHLAGQIHDLVGMHDRIEDSRATDGAAVPERLGDFCIVRKLAHGGMGEIYEAVQEHLQRRVAVKVIRRGRSSPESRDRFLREQQVLARLHQTHIIPIHTAGEEGRLQYFVMPYIEGAALHHVVRTARELETGRSGGKTPTLARLAGLAAESQAPAPPGEGPTEAAGGGGADAPTGRCPPATGGAAPRPLQLSRDYFRSVAQVMADAAEAVQYAHEAGVLHRDLKPANVLVDRGGKCWVIDFGLARWLAGEAETGAGPAGGPPGPEPFTASGVLGTPEYMAPEQLQGRADARTDVWGLGVTLYELLTLRRAFEAPTPAEVCEKIASRAPTPPRELVWKLPADLEAVCLKALHKEPGQRYPSAGALGADLRRWLRHEPTRARPAWASRRAGLWARRNPGWAAALLFGLLSTLALATAATLLEKRQADAAQDRAAAAEERVRERQRESLLRQLQNRRLTAHEAGWFARSWALVGEIAEARKDDELRNQAAATLVGIDARLSKTIHQDACSVAFDPDGKRLLLGGTCDPRGRAAEQGHVWDGGGDELRASGLAGDGPVAFRADGTPLQLAPRDARTLRLWDMAARRAVGEFKIVRGGKPEELNSFNYPALALAADGKLLAASAGLAGDKGTLVVWEAASGQELCRFPRKASALAFAPDGSRLAAADDAGRITLWSLPEGKELGTMTADQKDVHCLAFGRDYLPRGPAGGPGWLLASGASGGPVVIWDTGTLAPRAFCHGPEFDVCAVAFSPDETTLASSGRGPTRLWDVATGRPLLILPGRDFAYGLAFAPDGRRLAVSSVSVFADGGVDVWDLEPGRGIETLRGLAAPVSKVCYSADGRRVAALSHDWRVAVWDAGGRLRHVWDAPRGLVTADNAGLALSAKGGRVACSAGAGAMLWDVASGRQLRSWPLPPGFTDALAFHPGGQLLLLRTETRDGKDPPFDTDWRAHPRVCRLRDLLGQKPEAPLKEITDFNRHVLTAIAAPDGSHFVAEGLGGPDGKDRRIKAFAGPDGREVWSYRVRPSYDNAATLTLDTAGKLLAFYTQKGSEPSLVELPSGRFVGRRERMPGVLGAGGRYWGHGNGLPPFGFSLYRAGDERPLVVLGIGVRPVGQPQGPSHDGRLLAWGNADGTVTVCHLAEVRRRLAEVGLGW